MNNANKHRRLLGLGVAITALISSSCGGGAKDDSKSDSKAAKADEAKVAPSGGGAESTPKAEVKGSPADSPPADATPALAVKADATTLVGFVPDGANFVAVTDFKAFFASGLGEYYKLALAQMQGEGAEAMKAATACKIGPEHWSMAVIAGDTEKTDASVMAFAGTGLGKKETLQCLVDKAKEAGAKDEWKLGESNGHTTLDIGSGNGRAFAMSDDVLVLAGKDYIASVEERVGGNGKSAADGSLKEALSSVDKTKAIYIAGIPKGDVSAGPMSGIVRGSATVDVSSGLAVAFQVDFDDAAKAKSASDQLLLQINQIKPLAASVVPPAVMESLKVEAKDNSIHGSAKATNAELDKIRQTLAQTMGGIGDGGPENQAAGYMEQAQQQAQQRAPQ